MEGLNYSNLLKEAWGKAKKNYGMILAIFAVVFTVSIVFSQLIKSMLETAPFISFFLWIISVLVNAFLSLGFLRCLLRAADGKPIVFSEFFFGVDIFRVFLIGSATYGLIVLGGMILLVVPGIIWSIKYSFVQYLIADKGMDVKEAFSKSDEMTNGYKWNLFFLGVLAGLINTGGILLFGVGLLVTIPLTAMFYPIVFRQLSAEPAVAMPYVDSAGNI